jgi:hypothetical protein
MENTTITSDGLAHIQHYLKYDELRVDFAKHKLCYIHKGVIVAVTSLPDDINPARGDFLIISGLTGKVAVDME